MTERLQSTKALQSFVGTRPLAVSHRLGLLTEFFERCGQRSRVVDLLQRLCQFLETFSHCAEVA